MALLRLSTLNASARFPHNRRQAHRLQDDREDGPGYSCQRSATHTMRSLAVVDGLTLVGHLDTAGLAKKSGSSRLAAICVSLMAFVASYRVPRRLGTTDRYVGRYAIRCPQPSLRLQEECNPSEMGRYGNRVRSPHWGKPSFPPTRDTAVSS